MGEYRNALFTLALSPLFGLLWVVTVVVEGLRRLMGGRRRLPAPKSILITGATSGIGEGLALGYAAPGVHLALTGRQAGALAAVARACSAKGASVSQHVGDVTDRAALASWIDGVDAAAPLDLVIANAGVSEVTNGTMNDLEAAARSLVDINLVGVWNTIFPALAGMRKRGSGQIALMSSVASFGALTGSAAYCATKAALRVYGDALRAQLSREGIHVNTICPGFVKTPMTDASVDKHPQPFKVPMATAVGAIQEGLAYDDSVIAFPSILVAMGHWIGCMPSLIRDTLAKARVLPAIAYMRKSSKRAAATAVAAATATTASASASATRSRSPASNRDRSS